ncbi:cloacin [Erwinia sp. S43]|uniref:colicin E3-like toxin immunity protein n=1 Tax=Erwinia sp. S43 TaxID=2769339 RepID=UPI00190C9ABD|nr:colicin E3-like toxin immunity protein [Erwinia sp. S43]MBK0035791.1 cloacin [Erwinia sp. S43]
MGLKLRIECFELLTERFICEDYSDDLGDDGSVIERLGLPLENNINNGGFNVLPEWVAVLQPFFSGPIEPDHYLYQISFDYRDGDW